MIQGEKSRRSLQAFIRQFWHIVEPTEPFVPGLHIDALCDHLTNIKDIRNLLVCMPPRHTKSLTVSVFWFAWLWLHEPSTRFLYASYSMQLSTRDSVKCRRLIDSEPYKTCYGHLFQLTGDQNTKTRFENNRNGFRLASSVEGSCVGEGGEFLVADDPHNIAEIESRAQREQVIRWFAEVFTNRLNNPATGCRIVVMQRCHHEDLAGHILANDTRNAWTKLILPLEAGKARTLSTRWLDPRADGELLCPARVPQEQVDFYKASLPRRAFAAQFNQNPAPAEDAAFNPENFRYYDLGYPPEKVLYRLAAADLAISKQGDYTAVVVVDVTESGQLYVVHVVRQRTPGPRIVPLLEQVNEDYKPLLIYIEDLTFQRVIIDECRMRRLPVRGLPAIGDKESRSIILQVAVENNNLYLPTGVPWLKQVQDELEDFPNGSHDDVLDALSYVAMEANKMRRRTRPDTAKAEPQRNYVAWLQDALLEGLKK